MVSKTSKLVKSMGQVNVKATPIATDIILPNHSGIKHHPEMNYNYVPYIGAIKDVELGEIPLRFGEDNDAAIEYDGTDLIILPDANETGSGIVKTTIYITGTDPADIAGYGNTAEEDWKCITFRTWNYASILYGDWGSLALWGGTPASQIGESGSYYRLGEIDFNDKYGEGDPRKLSINCEWDGTAPYLTFYFADLGTPFRIYYDHVDFFDGYSGGGTTIDADGITTDKITADVTDPKLVVYSPTNIEEIRILESIVPQEKKGLNVFYDENDPDNLQAWNSKTGDLYKIPMIKTGSATPIIPPENKILNYKTLTFIDKPLPTLSPKEQAIKDKLAALHSK
jgi:hypothetical protein